MSKVQITIFTYNRQREFKKLMEALADDPLINRAFIQVMDDYSMPNYSGAIMTQFIHSNYHLYRVRPNGGKKMFWRLWNISLSFLRQRECDYYIFMADDYIPVPNFIQRLINEFEAIQDRNKCALTYCYPREIKGKMNWTKFKPVRLHDNLWQTQYVDGAFICNRNFMEALNWHIQPIPQTRWFAAPDLGSGVGEQISKRIRTHNLNMYALDKSLVYLQETDSKMNFQIRKKNPLTPDV